MSADEVVDAHADCPPAIWNGHTFECRNHHPFVEVPRIRVAVKRVPPPQVGAKARRQHSKTGPPAGPPADPPADPSKELDTLVRSLSELVEGCAREYERLSDEMVEGLEPLAKLEARLAGLEQQSKLYFAHVQDNIAHVQRLAGRLLKLEHWANGGDVPPIVPSLTPEPDITAVRVSRVGVSVEDEPPKDDT